MRVIIYNFEELNGKDIRKRLCNGESLLERQLRMLKSLGIRNIEITGSKTLYEYGKTCISNRQDLKMMSLRPYQNRIQCSYDDILLIHSQLLFQYTVIKDLCESTEKCRVLAEFKETKKQGRFCVRLDMDQIIEISDQIYGLDCAPVYPMIYISFKCLKEILPDELEQKLRYDNNQAFLSSFIQIVSEKVNDILLFEDAEKMKIVRSDEDYALTNSMRENDKECRFLLKESGGIVFIKELFAKDNIQHVMVITDDTFYTMPFSQLFSLQDIAYNTFFVSDKNTKKQKEELKTSIRKKNIDLLLAVGGKNILKIADTVRKELFPEQGLYPELKLMAVPDFSSKDYKILADYIILDTNIIRDNNNPKNFEENKYLINSVSSTKILIKKKIIKELKKNKWIRKLYSFLFKKVLFTFYKTIYPVDVKLIVFEAYGGNDQDGYACNTKAIYEAMLLDPDYFDYKFVWAFKHPKVFQFLKENQNTMTIKRESRKYLKFCARAGYIFTNTGVPRYIKPGKHQKLVYTWHGKPLKRIGCSFEGSTEGKRNKRQILRDYTHSGKKLSVLLSPAPVFTPIMSEAYHLSSQKRQTAILESGYPRNDYLFKYTEEDVLRIKMNLQIPLNKKVILYAPTWRPFNYLGGRKYKHTDVLDMGQMKTELEDNYVLLCRLHNLERGSVQFNQYPGFLYDVSAVRDINELYIISDLLVSDYSGSIFDFANLKRPIVLFMYDLDEYVTHANGLNFDLDFLPGPIVKNQNELIYAIKHETNYFYYGEKYQRFNETCNCLDGPDCALRTARQIVEINPKITLKQQFAIGIKKNADNAGTIFRVIKDKIPFLIDENTRKIISYRNKYKGKRCFLIGNGPSLRLADLNMLRNEYCFGCNMIYKIFERSDWRPDFLCASDPVVARTASKELQAHPECTVWVNRNAYKLMEYKGDNLIYTNFIRKKKYCVHGNISEYYIPSVATVMTFMLELAMYMGFSEIYLLGVDFTIGRNRNDHFINNYRDNEMIELERKKIRNKFRGENIGIHEGQVRAESRALYAYRELSEYAEKKHYKIYNATRGGALEVFQRVNFEDIIKGN